MWRQRYKYYMTKDPQYVITAVSTIATWNHFEKLNETYRIDQLEKDPLYRELYAYCLQSDGYDFIPIAFSDRVPKLAKLPKLESFLEMHWCIGYITPYFVGGNTNLLSGVGKRREIIIPSFEILMGWLKHHVNNYTDSPHNSINQTLAKECLRKYIYEHENIGDIKQARKFTLLANNKVCFLDDIDNCQGWIDYLENLKNRELYEIVVNSFI